MISTLSINLVSFPDKCKAAKISHCIKKVSKLTQRTSDPSRALPISKIIERIIQDQTMNFLSNNNFIYK